MDPFAVSFVQFPGAGHALGAPGLSGPGFAPAAAGNRSLGLGAAPELPAAMALATTQALTVALLAILVELLTGRNGSRPAGLAGGAAGTAGATATGRNAAGASPEAPSQSTPPARGALRADSKGRVSPRDLQAYLEQRIAGSKLNGFKPRDGARYGVDGSPRSWAAFMTKLVAQESDYDTRAVGDVGYFRGGSRGLFQLSYDDATSYGLNGGKPFTAEQLADPAVNADAAVSIMERLVLKSGSISDGGGRYWAPIKRGWTG